MRAGAPGSPGRGNIPGAAGKEAGAAAWSSLGAFYPDDSSAPQTFPLPAGGPLEELKILFATSTDFYGRITLYSLALASS